jgi:hypothetical protein
MKIQVWGVSTGRPGTPQAERPRCSFCQRGPDESRRILVAPDASICQECVEGAQAVLMESVPAQ